MPTVTITFSAYAQKLHDRMYYVQGNANNGYLTWASDGTNLVNNDVGYTFPSGNPQYLFASDNQYGFQILADTIGTINVDVITITEGISAYLILKNGSGASSIPNDATITGIQVYIEHRLVDQGEASYGARLDRVYLSKDGTNETGVDWFTDNSIIPPLWNLGADETEVAGNTSYLWGTTWTPSEVKSSNFGIVLSTNIFKDGFTSGINWAQIDRIHAVVTYTGGTTSDNITPYGIRSTEFVTSLHRIRRNINQYAIRSIERLGFNTLTKGAAQVRPYGQVSAQNLGQARLRTNRNINPYGIRSIENIGRNSLLQNIKPPSIRSLETLSQNKFISSIKTFSVLSPETLGQTRVNRNINPFGIRSNDALGNQNIRQNINPFAIRSIENIGFDKIVRNINPYSINNSEFLGRNSLIASLSIRPYSVITNELVSFNTRLSTGLTINHISIRTAEQLGRETLRTSYQINPYSIESNQVIGSHRISTSNSIYPRPIVSIETLGIGKFRNRFYDTLDAVNIFNFGNTDQFIWEQANSIYPGGRTLRRSTAFPNTTGTATIALPLFYDRGADFYWAGYLQVLSGSGIAGMAFAIQSTDIRSGYFVVINTANTGANPSFSIRRTIGGTTTTLASYNLTGLIVANSLYRITVTWSSTGQIVAKLYAQGGGSLVSAGILTVTDTTYTTGYIGISAFSDAAFDHLTNIEAQFADPVYGITSVERLGLATLLSGASSIRSISILSIEKANNLVRLSPQNNINPKTILSLENLGSSNRLSPGGFNINPYGILANERVLNLNRFFAQGSQIAQIPILSTELLGRKTIVPGGRNINPFGIRGLESIGFPRVRNNNNILPYSILSSQLVGFNRLSTISNILPRPIISTEFIGLTTLSKSANIIRPYPILSTERIGFHRLSSSSNIIPYPVLSSELLGRNRLSTTKNILPYSIISTEKVSDLIRFSFVYNIIPYGVRTTERTGFNTLSSKRNIIPYSILTLENIGRHTLSSFRNINPYGIRANEIVS